MEKYTKTQVKEMAKRAADVEIYRFNQQDKYIRGIHTDNISSTDMDIDNLPEEFTGIVQLMNEGEYEHSILANSSMVAAFAEWYGSKNVYILVVALSMNQ